MPTSIFHGLNKTLSPHECEAAFFTLILVRLPCNEMSMGRVLKIMWNVLHGVYVLCKTSTRYCNQFTM